MHDARYPDWLMERFWAKVEKTEACWTWTAAKNRAGYYEFHVDHLCRNTSCVNPEHLEVVSQRDNILRGCGLVARNVLKTHCVHGHELQGDNLHINVRGDRVCKTCRRLNQRRYDARGRIAR